MKDFEAKAGNDIKSSILSSPALRKTGMLVKSGVPVFFVFQKKQKEQKRNKPI